MEINELIVKYLVGCLSEEEDKTLKKWLQEDESHQLFFQEICSNQSFLEGYRQYHRLHAKSNEAFHKTWSSLHQDSIGSNVPKQKLGLSRYWLKIACSLLVLFLFSAGIFYFYYDSTQITPGESKALLTLEDGSTFQLKASGQEQWIYVANTPIARECNGSIVYHIPEALKKAKKQLNTLSVPRGGEFHLILSDGTKVHLNSLSELLFPVSFEGQKSRTVELKGEAYFEIAKDSLHPFKVMTQGLLIQQIGTKFNVKSRAAGKVEVALVEGRIGICPPSQEMLPILAGQLAVWSAASNTVSVENKELLSHTAWHSNRFVFYDESLGNLMEDLALWYNVDVEFLDDSLKKLHFTGSLYRYDDITIILNAIKETVNVDFKISGLHIKIDRNNK